MLSVTTEVKEARPVLTKHKQGKSQVPQVLTFDFCSDQIVFEMLQMIENVVYLKYISEN